jgi:hypothetical protein
VKQDDNPRFWTLLRAFEKHSGFPVLLNTSFNTNHEPIVETIDDAVACFLTTSLDFLVVDDLVVERTPEAGRDMAVFTALAARPRPEVMLSRFGRRERLRHEGWAHVIFARNGEMLELSAGAFAVLSDPSCAPARSLALRDGSIEALGAELHRLWTRRVIDLVPATG